MAESAFRELIAKIGEARGQGKSMHEMMKMAEDYFKSQPPDGDSAKRERMLKSLQLLMGAAPQIQKMADALQSGDQKAGMASMFQAMGKLQAAEPPDARAAKRDRFKEAMERARVEHEELAAAHRKERLARGLSERAGAGEPEPQVTLFGLPLPELDLSVESSAPLDARNDSAVKTIQARYGDKYPILKGLGKTIANVEAAKQARDVKALSALPIGATRIGGIPDLPPGFIWPTFRNQKIPFIAQINLADFPSAHGKLPSDGHLFFFMLGTNEDQLWSTPPASVSLYRGDTSSLIRSDHPADSEIWEDWTGTRVYEILPAAAQPAPDAAKQRSVAYLFGEMDGCFGTVDDIADRRFQEGDDWIALLSVKSVGSMQWSDAGDLYFFIRKTALAKLEFSNVIAAACSS